MLRTHPPPQRTCWTRDLTIGKCYCKPTKWEQAEAWKRWRSGPVPATHHPEHSSVGWACNNWRMHYGSEYLHAHGQGEAGRQPSSHASESLRLLGQALGKQFTITRTSLLVIKNIQKWCLSRAKKGTWSQDAVEDGLWVNKIQMEFE